MYRSSFFLTTALIGTTIALVQPIAAARSASEVETIARAVTVEIKLKSDPKAVGSGVIIHRKGDLYTLVTNRHVICGDSNCNEISATELYSLNLPDGQQYRVQKPVIKLLGDNNDLDLAIIQFRSNRNYNVAQLSSPGSLKITDKVFTAGFPLAQPGFSFNDGEAISVVNKRLNGDGGGYTVIYNAPTLPGMSGGGVFNNDGQLVAIHGYGDRYTQNTDIEANAQEGSKVGYNRGIPIRWLVKGLAEIGISLGRANVLRKFVDNQEIPSNADEHFITGFNKFVDPGNDVIAGKQQAIRELTKAIQLNPQYGAAYFLRALAYEQVQDFQKSLMDYNKTISLNPKDSNVYNNRAILKQEKLNDLQGALADYNQTLILNPQDAKAYYNRARLKQTKLQNWQGALADYNQAIRLNPKDASAYNNRGLLKDENLNDTQGALADYNQSFSLNPKNHRVYYNRANLKRDKLKDFQGALADYNQAIILNPKYFEAYNNRALLKNFNLKDFRGSLNDFNAVIALDPKSFQAYYNRAILKKDKLNDFQGALADLNQSISINPQLVSAYGVRGVLKYTKLNDRPGAIADMRQVAKLARSQNNVQFLKIALETLQAWGATE
jgi:tetratricopeptide (TPR) repeat protein